MPQFRLSFHSSYSSTIQEECQALRHQATGVVDLRPRSCLGVGDHEAATREPLGKLKIQHSPSLAFPEQLTSTFRYNTSVKRKKKRRERERERERAGVFITHGTMAVSEVAVHITITNTTRVYLLVPGTASWLGSCFREFHLTSVNKGVGKYHTSYPHSSHLVCNTESTNSHPGSRCELL